MNNILLVLCLIGHILGDYYFQTNKMAQQKGKRIKSLLIHGLFYSLPFFIIFLLTNKTKSLAIGFFVIMMLHIIIDTIKFVCMKLDKKAKKQRQIYLFDQFIHIISIIIVCFYIDPVSLKPAKWLQEFLFFYHITSVSVLKWFLLTFLLYKPINITFAKLFSTYKPIVEDEDSTKKAGAIIGFLERFLIVIFLSLSQYSAIGLILTAKSIARYDMISKNREFAEYYLIGTLISVLSSILCYYFIFSWL